jgi:hypothetical protein
MNSTPTLKLGLYKHYKGKLYKVTGIVKHSETLEDLVSYECLYENELASHWVRPIAMFLETVNIDGIEKPRFEYVGNKKGSLSDI